MKLSLKEKERNREEKEAFKDGQTFKGVSQFFRPLLFGFFEETQGR